MIFENCGLEHLHLHSDQSLLDGLGKPSEYAARCKQINQKYLCISDHGVQSAIPAQIKACEKNNISPIFACELYLQPDHDPATFSLLLPEDKKKIRKSYHLLAIAYSNEGYKNLIQLSSWAWLNGFYYKPRINYEILEKHKEGIIFTSCCIGSLIGSTFLEKGKEAAFEIVEKHHKMFGKNFFLELMMLDYDKQPGYDAFLIEAHDKYHIPLIITQDVHYCQKEDSAYQRIMLMMQTGRTLEDIAKAQELSGDDGGNFFELQDQNLWLKSEEELNEFWEAKYQHIIPYELFCEAKRNTVRIAEKCKGVTLNRESKLPMIANADEKLLELVKIGFKKRNLPKTKIYRDRLVEELDLITRKNFASYFLIQKQVIDEARRYCIDELGMGPTDGVGPGRGSSAGSLILFCLGITDVEPISNNLLFSRFLSESRGRQIRFKFSENID